MIWNLVFTSVFSSHLNISFDLVSAPRDAYNVLCPLRTRSDLKIKINTDSHILSRERPRGPESLFCRMSPSLSTCLSHPEEKEKTE